MSVVIVALRRFLRIVTCVAKNYAERVLVDLTQIFVTPVEGSMSTESRQARQRA